MMTTGCTAILVLALTLPAMADATDDDHEAVRRAVDSGKARTLAELKRVVMQRVPGEIVSVKLDRERSVLVYEFRILTANGRLVEAEVDAADGRILEIENE
jgi:uncharacterized membrane protein YkoI